MHFYASVSGRGKTEATKGGTKETGLDAHVRGWTSGIRVVAEHINGVDCFTIFATTGSDGSKRQVEIGYYQNGTFTLKSGESNVLGKPIKINL